MTTKTLNFTTLTAADPYVIGSAPDNLTGYTQPPGSNNAKIFNTGVKEWVSAGTQAVIYDNTLLTGTLIRSKIKMGSVSGNSAGAGFCNASGNGYMFITNNSSNNFRIYTMVASQLGTLIYTSPTLTPVVNNDYTIERDTVTGVMRLFDNAGSQIGSDSPANLTYSDARFACAVSRFGYVRALTSEFTPAQTIVSINGGSPITAGQTAIPIVATGFTAKPTAVTATYAKSITATVDSGGSATNFSISIQDRIEAEDWPLNGDTLTFTFTYGSESASGTQTLVKKASETVLTFSGAITSDPATLTYWLTQDGFTAEGGELAYIPYGDLVLTADGGGSATDAGTFTSWFRPSTGTGAGNVYAYTWVVSEEGITPSASGLTSSGLTSSGLTRPGLTSAGL